MQSVYALHACQPPGFPGCASLLDQAMASLSVYLVFSMYTRSLASPGQAGTKQEKLTAETPRARRTQRFLVLSNATPDVYLLYALCVSAVNFLTVLAKI